LELALKRKIFYSSIACLFYFSGMLFVSKYQIDVTFLGVLVEILTIPFLILIPALVTLIMIYWSKEKWRFSSNYIGAIILLMGTVILLIYSD